MSRPYHRATTTPETSLNLPGISPNLSPQVSQLSPTVPGTPRPLSVSLLPSNLPRNTSSDSFSSSTPLRRPLFGRSPESSPRLDSNMHSRNGSLGTDAPNGNPENTSIKKRLVEQFYKMDGKSKAPRAEKYSDYARELSRARETRGATSGSAGDSIGDDIVALEPFDEQVLDPSECAESLINVDTQRADFELERVRSILAQTAATLERAPHFENPIPSGQRQLLRVEEHLRSLQSSVDKISAEVSGSIDGAKAQYHEQTQRSMAKVARLSELLKTLAARVEASKTNMANSRGLLETEIAAKIGVLEQVSLRFDEYDHANRQRRVRQIAVALTSAAVLLSVYMATSGLGWCKGTRLW